MLPQNTAIGTVKRIGNEDAYHGRPKNPPFRAEALFGAYIDGYRLGREQRLIEIAAHTHYSLYAGPPTKHHRRSA